MKQGERVPIVDGLRFSSPILKSEKIEDENEMGNGRLDVRRECTSVNEGRYVPRDCLEQDPLLDGHYRLMEALWTFNFENGFLCFDFLLQEIKIG